MAALVPCNTRESTVPPLLFGCVPKNQGTSKWSVSFWFPLKHHPKKQVSAVSDQLMNTIILAIHKQDRSKTFKYMTSSELPPTPLLRRSIWISVECSCRLRVDPLPFAHPLKHLVYWALPNIGTPPKKNKGGMCLLLASLPLCGW